MVSIADVSVRQVEGPDISICASLRRARFEEQEARTVEDANFGSRSEAWLDAEKSRRALFVASVADLDVGMLNLAIFERMPRPERARSCWCYVGNAFVLSRFRNLGIGTALLDVAISHSRQLGAVRIVLSSSTRAVPFYERAGFGPATMLMALDLSDSKES